MAREVTTSYRNSPDRLWDSVDVSLLETDMIRAGVGDVSGDGTDCQVTENGTPDTTVLINVGRVYVTGIDDGQEDSHTERLYIRTQRQITIPANAGGTNRVDAIIARVDVDAVPDTDADNTGTIERINGTGATALSDGAITTAVGDDAWYRLADVTATPSFVTITNSDIADKREPFRINLSAIKSVINGELGYMVATGSSNNFNVTLPIPLLAIPNGLAFAFKANHTISSSATVTITDSRGVAFSPITLKKEGGATSLESGDIIDGMVVPVQTDGTNLQMLCPPIPDVSAATNDFGDGSDGTDTIAAPTTLAADMQYADLTINNGIELDSGGYTIKVQGVLTFGNASSKILLNGNAGNAGSNGSGTTGGAGGSGGAGVPSPAGSLPVSKSGVTGGTGGNGTTPPGGSPSASPAPSGGANNGSAETSGIGGTGATGAPGGSGGSADGPGGGSATGTGGSSTASSNALFSQLMKLPIISGTIVLNGSGGSGSGGGGGGGHDNYYFTQSGGGGGGAGGTGSNGGNIWLAAKTITGAGDIEAIGGAGGDGGDGANASGANAGRGGGGAGGTGGGGGCVIVVYNDISGWSGDIVVDGGAGGAAGDAGSGTGSGGSNGTAGTSGATGTGLAFFRNA